MSIDDAWAEHRPYLVNLAFRMLGDIGEAEDAVQEAFARMLTQDLTSIEDVRGWLIVVTSRLCLDQIRSARRRLQRPQDFDVIEAVTPGVGPSFVDPADRVTLDDSVRIALTVVLDRLTAAERVVFVLHDIFEVPFDSVSESVGRSAEACRQLARRARLKIADATGAGSVVSTEHRRITERFIDACASGDLDALVQLLDPSVSGEVDLISNHVFTGADVVAGNILRFWGWRARLVAITTGPTPLLLGFVDRELRALIELTMSGDRVSAIHVTTAPKTLEQIIGR